MGAGSSLTPGRAGQRHVDENVELARESIVSASVLRYRRGASVLFPENTVSTSLAMMPKNPEAGEVRSEASTSITISEDVQKASIDKGIRGVRELKRRRAMSI